MPDPAHPATTARTGAAFLMVGVVTPVALLLAAAAFVAASLPHVPNPVAIHWSGPRPDAFAPVPMLFLTPLIGIGVVALLASLGLLVRRIPSNGALNAAIAARLDNRPTPPADPAQAARGQRLMATISAATGALLAVTTVGSVIVQRGLTDAADAGDILPWILVGFAGALVGGAVGWFAQPGSGREMSTR